MRATNKRQIMIAIYRRNRDVKYGIRTYSVLEVGNERRLHFTAVKAVFNKNLRVS